MSLVLVETPPHLGMFYILSSFTIHYCPSYGFLQYRLCQLDWDRGQINTYLKYHLWHINNTWMWHQQAFTKGFYILKIWQNKIEVRVKVMEERWFLSSLTHVKTRTLNPYFANKSFICKTKALFVVFVVANYPMITWQGSHLSFKKCTIITKVPIPFLDIQRSKLMVQELHEWWSMWRKYKKILGFFCHPRQLTLAFPRIMYTTTMNISQNHANNNKLWNSLKLKIENLQSSWKLWNCKVCRNCFISKIKKHKILTHASSHVFHVKILQWNNKVGSKFVTRVRSCHI